MKDAIETAIKALTNKSVAAANPNEATQYSQAALNLAHTFATLENIPKGK